MKTSLLRILCAAALLSTPVFADEGDPLRGKIKELEERARAAKEQGRAEESKELMQQVRRLHAELGEREGKRGGGEKLEMMKHKIGELRQAGKPEEAEQLERHLREATQAPGESQRKDGAGEVERRQHALEAIKHLHAAGLHEPAERIEQMLRELGGNAERSGPGAASPQAGPEQMQRAMREMQEQTQRALRETHEQMAKMARAIAELREQAGKPRGDGERRKD